VQKALGRHDEVAVFNTVGGPEAEGADSLVLGVNKAAANGLQTERLAGNPPPSSTAFLAQGLSRPQPL